MHPHWLCSTPMRVDSLPLKSSVSCRLLKPVIFKCKANASVKVNFQHCFPSSAVMFIISALSGHIFINLTLELSGVGLVCLGGGAASHK